MWQVENRTPFAVDRAWVRDRDGAEVWLVAVRGTFLIHQDGRMTLAAEQAPVVLAPTYLGDPGASSLQYDTDFVLTKPTTDVILHGSAYAPHGRPTTALYVSLRVGEVAKTLSVTGDRRYRQTLLGISPTRAQPFTQIPLTYERAYGGAEPVLRHPDQMQCDDRNPIGTGYRRVVGRSAANIEYPDGGRQPAGFGPIPLHWQPRARFAGTYDDVWRRERYPLYPRDLDDRFFLCSPADQRPSQHLKGGERVELTNLTPTGQLSFLLPRVTLGFATVFLTGQRVLHRALLYTVILEPDVPRVILVWRTSLPCHANVHSLLGTIVWEKQINGPGRGQQPGSAVDDGALA